MNPQFTRRDTERRRTGIVPMAAEYVHAYCLYGFHLLFVASLLLPGTWFCVLIVTMKIVRTLFGLRVVALLFLLDSSLTSLAIPPALEEDIPLKCGVCRQVPTV